MSPHNMVNFGPLAAEIDPVVWGTLRISTGFASWQCYCTALQQWASAKLCGVEQRAPPIIDRATITLGIAHILVYSIAIDQQIQTVVQFTIPPA